jgi:hypothetical protein
VQDTFFHDKLLHMIHHWKHLLSSALFLAIVSQNQLFAQETLPQPPAETTVQVYLTASFKNDSNAMLVPSELLTLIDTQSAQITSLRTAKEDNLLFVLMIDTSTSQARKAKSIKRRPCSFSRIC